MGLKFNPFTGKLDFTGSAGGGSPTGAAGGDLAGTYPNPTVDGLQGRPVSNATPVNGQVLQFDGTNWVPGAIPTGGSGGGGVLYYLNFNTAADTPLTNIPQTPNATKELGLVGETTGTSYLSPILSTASYDFLASFATDLNVPSATAIPAGIWDFNIFANSTTTNNANQVYFKVEIRKYDGTNAPVLIASSGDVYIYDPGEITQYVASVVMPQTTILSTDRIVIYIYGRAHQNNNRLTFNFGDGYPSHTHSTMPSVTGTGVVKVVNGVYQSPATTIVNADVSASAAIAQSKIANLTTDLAAKIGGSVGAVDNAVPRADGTGGTILQSSNIVIDDVVDSFAFTCNGDTDIFTATGHNFTTNQRVMVGSLGGNYTPLNTTTFYFVINISGNAFQLSTTSGGSAINMGAGSSNGNIFAIQPNVTLTPSGNSSAYALVLNPKGASSLIIGNKPDGTTAGGGQRGGASFDFSTSRTSANQVASGFAAFLMGNECTASAIFSFAFGYRANATGAQSIAGAWDNTASGSGSLALGGTANIANATYAAAINGQNNRAQAQSTLGIGENSNADRRSMLAHAAGQFAANGDAQRARFVLRGKTTTNAAVEMALDGGTTYLGIPSGKVIACTINISGVKSDGSAVAHYVRQYAVKNVAGTSSEVYAPVTIGTDNAVGTTIALSANNADDTLRIAVTGIAAETWRWVASVDAVEIAYGT